MEKYLIAKGSTGSTCYWTKYHSFEIILEWEWSIGLEFKFIALYKPWLWKTFNLYELYIKKYLIAEGSSGS